MRSDNESGYADLEHYDADVLKQVSEAHGYAINEQLECEGQPLDLQNPEVPLSLAYHVLDGHTADEMGGRYWSEGWAQSLASLAHDLACRCLNAEEKLDAIMPSWREEARNEQVASFREDVEFLERGQASSKSKRKK